MHVCLGRGVCCCWVGPSPLLVRVTFPNSSRLVVIIVIVLLLLFWLLLLLLWLPPLHLPLVLIRNTNADVDDARILSNAARCCSLLSADTSPQDLTNPFVGRYKVRRTTTTAVMVKIRSEIVAVRAIKKSNIKNK